MTTPPWPEAIGFAQTTAFGEVTSVSQMAAYQVCSHSASVCPVDHVLHGNCPDVMTLGSQ